MEIKSSTGMVVDGVFACQAIDSSGEILEIEGLDITDFVEGRGLANYEHLGAGDRAKDDAKPSHGQEIVGKIIYAKKILKESDIENDRQRKYWQQTKGIPFLYGMVRLYDGAGHEGAMALAAGIRDHVANNEPIMVQFSIEGSTTSRAKDEPNRITGAIARRVAMTVKPCNKTARSGLVLDPNAPSGWDKNPERVGEKDILEGIVKFDDPAYSKIGGSFEYYGDPIAFDSLEKTLTAGNTNVAPSQLTGGAALQREDVGNLRNQILAAIRDYGKKPFNKNDCCAFVKARLPEISDDFLDHFTDLADDYTAKIKKADPAVARPINVEATQEPDHIEAAAKIGLKPLIRSGQHLMSPKGRPLFKRLESRHGDPAIFESKSIKTKDGTSKVVFSLHRGSQRGKLLRHNPEVKGLIFDEKRGIAHFPFGSYKLYNPDKDDPKHAQAFHDILNDPSVGKFHDEAMEHWVKVHKLFKAGKLPPEVLMHSVILSGLSPNTPVPIQELMYGKLVDKMKETGVDPRHPKFSEIVGKPWLATSRDNKLPEHSRDYFANNPGILVGGQHYFDYRDKNIAPPSKYLKLDSGFGNIKAFQLPENKLANISKYHQMHDFLMDSINRNPGDARSVITEWMREKVNPKGVDMSGLSNKTGRYVLGMVGGGNVMVPDTHFIRHLLGMESGVDSSSLGGQSDSFGVRAGIWNPAYAKELEGIDRWYAQNHPAVKHMLNHPKWGKYFENPEDAIFPAFWKHWIAIAPHERFRGMENPMATNEGTTHKPFWDAIAPYIGDDVQKSDDAYDSHDIAEHTAKVHAQYIEHFGEIPAMMLYYRNLVPKLLEAAEKRESNKNISTLLKSVELDSLYVDIKKSYSEIQKYRGPITVYDVSRKRTGRKMGSFVTYADHVQILEDHDGFLHKIITEGKLDDSSVAAIHGLESSPEMIVDKTVMDHKTPDPEETLPEIHTEAPVEELATVNDPVFLYRHVGIDSPQILEMKDGMGYLNGHPLEAEDLEHILEDIGRGVASIKYYKPESLSKAENNTDDDELSDVMAHIRKATAAGILPPHVERYMTKRIYEDPMTPGIGNKAAFLDFQKKRKPGVYVSMDGNDFSEINNTFGHATGDAAIKAFGKAAREAMDESVGREHGKLFRSPPEQDLFRNGGDEFVAYFPSHEHAAKFARALHSKLSEIPPIHGLHNLSMSIGFGHDIETADKALYKAKESKYLPGQEHLPARQRQRRPGFEVGKVPNLVHSLVPGHEGPISVSEAHNEPSLPKN